MICLVGLSTAFTVCYRPPAKNKLTPLPAARDQLPGMVSGAQALWKQWPLQRLAWEQGRTHARAEEPRSPGGAPRHLTDQGLP